MKSIIKDLKLLSSKRMTNTFHDFVNVIRKGPKVRNKINYMLDRYMRLPYNYQSKIGYDTLIQNAILKELIIIMSTIITDLDIELKMKINQTEHLENIYSLLSSSTESRINSRSLK